MSCDIKTKHLPSDIQTLVAGIAEKEGLVKPVLNFCYNGKGEGLLGIIYYVSVTDVETSKVLELAVKTAPNDPNNMVSDIVNKAYCNEVHFYNHLWRDLREQQKSVKRQLFDAIPTCYSALIVNSKRHKIVMEDLTAKGFHTMNKRKFFDEKHMQLLLKEYGKFHALSFSLNSKFPEKFHKFSQNFSNVFYEMKHITLFVESMRLIFRQCFDLFSNEPDQKLRNIVKYYSENGVNMYFDCQETVEENLVFNHGDCWSNNIMFRHNVSVFTVN